MSEHRFHVGELVYTRTGVCSGTAEALIEARTERRSPGIYEVARVLPELINGEPQYRIRCVGEPERVVRESQLTPAVRKSQPHHAPGTRGRI